MKAKLNENIPQLGKIEPPNSLILPSPPPPFSPLLGWQWAMRGVVWGGLLGGAISCQPLLLLLLLGALGWSAASWIEYGYACQLRSILQQAWNLQRQQEKTSNNKEKRS